ncbi:hypothetical protein F5I97DRAFT_1931298 [Phlebopus sp. FC_14]|nr:hypothetical protein F5I97DRAFT_1931298 [Phlebopus sp. FC_14]
MEASAHRAEEERQKQLEIRRQIKLLQSQLTDLPDDEQLCQSPKRKQPGATLLAPATPSPRKKRRVEQVAHGRKGPAPTTSRPIDRPREHDGSRRTGGNTSASSHTAPQHVKPAPSNVLSKLSGLSNRSNEHHEATPLLRSTDLAKNTRPEALSSMPMAKEPEHETSLIANKAPQRDDHLAIIEELEMGPVDHKPPPDDPLFERLEPNSGIRLSSRSLPHEDLQEYLRGRYYLSPSCLYSCVRLLPNKSGYDVPVAGDWVTIAVVAERGPIRTTRAPVDITPGDDGRASDDEAGGTGESQQRHNGKAPTKSLRPPTNKPHGKKYVNIKLIDFGARSRSSATGGKAVLRGDAFLSLLLFESERFDKVTEEDGRVKKLWHGGSGGAFEAMSKLKEGDVVTLLNPRVLKPFQRSGEKAHPRDNILGVTPESANSMAIIGRAQDLGMCKVVKRDGKTCGSWTDKRVSDVCEWHLTNAVQRQRAGRAEFSAGTSGMTSSSARKRKHDYDPTRQRGLKPEPSESNPTYIVSGHVAGGPGGETFVSEKIGREGQAKAKRRLDQDADRELKALLDRDKEGMKAVTKAREAAARMARASSGKQSRNGAKKGKQKAANTVCDEDEDWGGGTSAEPVKQAYPTHIIKQLGFDPAAKTGQKRVDDISMRRKLEMLAAVQSSRKNIKLGPRPGPKIRSGVSVPGFMLENEDGTVREEIALSDLDSDSPVDMVDLDASDI